MAIAHPNRSALWPSLPAAAAKIRAGVLAVAALMLSRVLFRLCLGRWPLRDEARLFAAGLRDQATPLPPCCRAMLNVPSARAQIGRVLTVDMVRRGTIGSHGLQPARSTMLLHTGNPLSFWRGPAIAFLHLEKTAGESLATLLTELFHPQQIDRDPNRTFAPHVVTPFAGRSTAAIRRHALIYGHYDLPSLRKLDPDRIVVTMLRDPAERLLSLYYYWRSIDLARLDERSGHAGVHLAHNCGLLEFLGTDDPVVKDYIDNFYVRRLTGLYATSKSGDRLAEAPDACLAAALAALERIEFVGITERMGPSVAALGAYFGFTPPASIPHDNTAAGNIDDGAMFRAVAREQLTPAHRRQLARLTRQDTLVYQAACDRFATVGGTAMVRTGDRGYSHQA